MTEKEEPPRQVDIKPGGRVLVYDLRPIPTATKAIDSVIVRVELSGHNRATIALHLMSGYLVEILPPPTEQVKTLPIKRVSRKLS